MALLWRTGDEPARRSGLTVSAIVAAGIAIADEVGLHELSMRRVAERLGVGAMSLYTYVQGKADLVAAMRDHVTGTSGPLTGTTWRERLESYARQQWALYHRHPWLLLAPTAHELPGPNETTRMEDVLATAASTGLRPPDMLGVFIGVDGYVRGVASLSVDAALAAKGSGQSEVEWYAERAPVLNAYVTPRRFPTMTSVIEADAFGTDGFDFGLARLLDGIEAHLSRTT